MLATCCEVATDLVSSYRNQVSVLSCDFCGKACVYQHLQSSLLYHVLRCYFDKWKVIMVLNDKSNFHWKSGLQISSPAISFFEFYQHGMQQWDLKELVPGQAQHFQVRPEMVLMDNWQPCLLTYHVGEHRNSTSHVSFGKSQCVGAGASDQFEISQYKVFAPNRSSVDSWPVQQATPMTTIAVHWILSFLCWHCRFQKQIAT